MLVFVTSTVFCQVTKCGDKVCITISEMDTLIYHDLGYKACQKDVVEYKAQIASKNTQISLLKNNEYDLKEAVRVQKMLADNYKSSAVQFQDKYSKAQDKVNRRGKNNYWLIISESCLYRGAYCAFKVVLKTYQ
jgi:hypothetical protein